MNVWPNVLSEADDTSLPSFNAYLDEPRYLLRMGVLQTEIYKTARGNSPNRARENDISFDVACHVKMVLERELVMRSWGGTLCISFHDSQINSTMWLRRGESLDLVNI